MTYFAHTNLIPPHRGSVPGEKKVRLTCLRYVVHDGKDSQAHDALNYGVWHGRTYPPRSAVQMHAEFETTMHENKSIALKRPTSQMSVVLKAGAMQSWWKTSTKKKTPTPYTEPFAVSNRGQVVSYQVQYPHRFAAPQRLKRKAAIGQTLRSQHSASPAQHHVWQHGQISVRALEFNSVCNAICAVNLFFKLLCKNCWETHLPYTQQRLMITGPKALRALIKQDISFIQVSRHTEQGVLESNALRGTRRNIKWHPSRIQ